MLNITDICQSQQEFFYKAHSAVAVPSIVLLYIIMHLTLLIVGLLIVEKKQKFFTIWIFSLVFNGVLIITAILIPSTIQSIITFLT